MRLRWLACLTALSLAAPALADDEGWSNRIDFSAGIPTSPYVQKGGLRLVWAGVICDDTAAATALGSETCMVDFGSRKSVGQGDLVVFMAPRDDRGFTCTSGVCTRQSPGADCGNATTYELTTGPARTASPSANAPNGTVRHVATTSTVITNSLDNMWLSLNTRYTPLDRYLFVAVPTLGATCDKNDLVMYVYDDPDT